MNPFKLGANSGAVLSLALSAVRLYADLLSKRPLLTKSVTSGFIAAAGNALSQVIRSGDFRATDWQSMGSFFVYGLIIIGTYAHYVYKFLDLAFPKESAFSSLKRVAFERLVATPILCLVTMPVLEWLQGGQRSWWTLLEDGSVLRLIVAHWKIWTLPQIVNVNMVPEKYRSLFANIVALLWNVYLATLSGAHSQKSDV